MRRKALRIEALGQTVVDTCGTGGDGANLFNVSTASSFVVAAGGGCVAKHGNRSVSSSSGSADVLEAAGVSLDLTTRQVAECVREVGVGFMFAPAHHSAMRHAIDPRKELGLRTIFNILGPMTNGGDPTIGADRTYVAFGFYTPHTIGEGRVCTSCHNNQGGTNEAIIQYNAEGIIDVKPMITHTFKLSDYAKAFQTVRDRAGFKVVIEPWA